MALFNRKKKDEEESRAPSSSRVADALRNIYQQTVESQRRAVEADQAVAREQARQVTNAAQGLYGAYQKVAGTPAERARNAAQGLYSTYAQAPRVQEATRNLYQAALQQQERAVRADMAVQQEQARRAQNAARGLYSAYQQQTERDAAAQVERDRAAAQSRSQRLQTAEQALIRQTQFQQMERQAQDQWLRNIPQAAKQGAMAVGKDAFNMIPKRIAGNISIDETEAMRAQLLRAGYSESAANELIASGELDPNARYKKVLPDNWLGQFAANYNEGDLQQQADIILGQGIIQGNQEWIQRGMELRQMATQYAQDNQTALSHNSGTIGNMINGTMAQYLPQLFYQEAASLPAQVPAMLMPNKYTEALAQAFGSASMSYTTMAGASYADLVEKGADPETAARMAKDEAAISSAIESFDTFWDFATGPMEGLNPFSKVGKKAAKKLTGRMAIGFGKWAGNTGQEYAEEAFQEMVSMANERRLADGNTDGGVVELLGYFFDEVKRTLPELFDIYKKDALGVFLNLPGAKEAFPELADEYKGIETTENAERVNEAGVGGAIIGGFMGAFGQATGAIRTRYTRNQINKAFDSLVSDTDSEALRNLTDSELAGATETAREMDRTDAAEILEAEQARRNTEQEAAPEIAPERQEAVQQAVDAMREQTAENPSSAAEAAPSPEGEGMGVPAPFTPITPQTNDRAARERRGFEQAAQDIQTAAQQGDTDKIDYDAEVAFVDANGNPVTWDTNDQIHEAVMGDVNGIRRAISDGYIRVKRGEGIELSIDNGLLTPQQVKAIRKIVDSFSGKTFNIDLDVEDENGFAMSYGALSFEGADIDGRKIVDAINREIRQQQRRVEQAQAGENPSSAAEAAPSPEGEGMGVPAPFTPITPQTNDRAARERRGFEQAAQDIQTAAQQGNKYYQGYESYPQDPEKQWMVDNIRSWEREIDRLTTEMDEAYERDADDYPYEATTRRINSLESNVEKYDKELLSEEVFNDKWPADRWGIRHRRDGGVYPASEVYDRDGNPVFVDSINAPDYQRQMTTKSESAPAVDQRQQTASETDALEAETEQQYNIIAHNDTQKIDNSLAEAYDKAVTENRGVTIPADLLAKYQSISNDPEQSLIQAVKDYYDSALKGTAVDVQMDNGVLTIMFENDGKRKSVGWRMKADKAATFELLRELTENAVYAYSEENRDVNERSSIPLFHYFANNARIGNTDIPVKIQARDIVVGQAPGTHYYTHTLDKNKARTAGPVSGTESSKIDSNAGTSRTTNVTQNAEEINPQNEGRASVEVPGEATEAQREAEQVKAEVKGTYSAYKTAVDNGDVTRAQEMVDDAARQAGYTVTAYHGGMGLESHDGTNAKWFTSNPDAASTYAEDNSEFLVPGKNKEQKAGISRAALNLGNSLAVDAKGAGYEHLHPWTIFPELKAIRGKETSAEYWTTLKWFEDELLLDQNSLSGTITTDEVVEYAKKKGYDSVTFNNIVDEHYSEKGAQRWYDAEPATVYAVFGNRYKSAAPVAYDSQGNVIPLSERFGSPADPHPERGEIGDNGIRICKDADALEAELADTGKGILRNDTGEYRAKIRQKKEGGALLTIDHDGKRSISASYGSQEEAAAAAISYIRGQTQAREDAALDAEKSAPVPQQTAVEAAVSGEAQDEYARQIQNRAAKMDTKKLKKEIKNKDADIRVLNKLAKRTGLSVEQQQTLADMKKTLGIYTEELSQRETRAEEKKKKSKVEVKGNKPSRSISEAKNKLMETFHTAAGQKAETGKALDARLQTIYENGKITEQDRTEIMDMLMDAGAVREEVADELKDVHDWLAGSRIYVADHEKADFGEDWNKFRQRAFAAGIYLTNNMTDRGADSFNAELAETFGEGMFPTDEAVSDMLRNLVEKAEAGKSHMIPFAQAIESEARGTRVDPQEIYSELSRSLDETLRAFGEKAQIEVDLKNKSDSMLATEWKRAEDRLERQAQQREENKLREKTMKAVKRLKKMRNKAAPEIKAAIDEVLKDIDTRARRLTIEGIEDLQALQRYYDERKKAQGWESPEHPGNFISNPYIEEKLKSLTQKHISDMDIDDVIELERVVSGLENEVRTQGKMIGDKADATVKEYADAVDAEVKSSKGAKPGFMQKWFKEESLSPRRFLDMLGGWKDGAMKKLSASLENGQTRMLDFQRRAIQSMDQFMSKKENRKWLKTASGKNAKWTTYSVANGLAMDGSGITGQSIELTPMMKVSLYLASLNEDNLRHIQTGGIRIPDKQLYIRGDVNEAYTRGQTVKMQPEAVRAIASTLTQEEKTFAGYLQKFFNEQSKEAINEVSMQLDGFERADVDQYFPIESYKAFTKSDVAKQAQSRTVEGIGSISNERVHAGNPIMLRDAYETFLKSVEDDSRYYGYAIPIRNFQAVRNYVFHEEGNPYTGSIKDTLNDKWGSGADKYIEKMLEDIQGGHTSKTGLFSRGLAALRSNLAGANLTMNPSVAVSQLASYPGAAQVVGWDGLAAGLQYGQRTAAAILSAQPGATQAVGADWMASALSSDSIDEKLIEKYTPLLWYRSQGYSTQEIGDAVSAEKKNLAQKALSSKALNWIQGMDRMAVKRLWAAAEYRVQKDNPGLKPGSKELIDSGMDPYYQKVAEVFNRAVYDTQPNYTDMERAQILRSDDELTKALTMYKTVPLQYYGMMVEAAGRLQAAKESGNEAEIRAARKYAANTFSGLLAANGIYVAIKAMFKGFRKKDDDYRDEEGELTAESVFKQLGLDLGETFAGSVIGGAEVWSLLESALTGSKWNAPEISALGQLQDIVNDTKAAFSSIDDGDPRAAAKKFKTVAMDLSAAFGLPLKNTETYLLASVRWASPATAMEYDNLFGGISKGSLKGMDENATGIGVNLILRNRTGADLDRSATDELARLYAEGKSAAIPTAIPESFEYGGNEVKIKDRRKYSETWGGVVGDNLEELLSGKDYRDADDKTKAAMISKLYQYATVQAREGADPEYSPEGNSTYGWTVKADAAMESGLDLPTVISAMVTMNGMTADKENGKTVVSKKSKVVQYIDGLDIDTEQKDALYEMAGYTSGLENAPWHGKTGETSGTTSGTKKTPEARLKEYQDVQTKKADDPGYDPAADGHAWTMWADRAVEAGIDIKDAIGHMTALSAMKADYNEYGKAISGSKKEKVCNYIDALPLTNDQKDVLYLYVYNQNSLKYTPWHGYTGKKKKRRGGRRGGRRRASAKTTKPVQVGKLASGYDTGVDISTLFGGGSGKRSSGTQSASAGLDLLELVNKYYDGNPLAAALDGGRKARTKVDFKI